MGAVGIVVADMGKALGSTGASGCRCPRTPTTSRTWRSRWRGLRLLFDTEATIRSFHPDWQRGGGGGRLGLAFALPDPAAVDAAYAELTGAGCAR